MRLILTWDIKTGKPLPNMLKRLSLEAIIKYL